MRKNPFFVRKLGVMISFELLFVGIGFPRALKFKFPSTTRDSNFHHSTVCVLTNKLETCLPHQNCIFLVVPLIIVFENEQS